MWAQIGQRQCDAYPHRRQTSADEAGMSIFTAVNRFKPQLFVDLFALFCTLRYLIEDML